jgi:hypothetical protein
MRKLLTVAGLAGALLVLGAGAALAAAADTPSDDDVVTLPQPRPAWLTDDLEARILNAGPAGVEVALGKEGEQATVNPDCLGTAPPYAGTDGVSLTAVSAGTCMVSPNGCTMNFVFTDGTSSYIGTAGHCVAGGRTVIAQIGTRVDPTDTVFVTLAAIGRVVKSMNSGIGKDFALVKIDPGYKVVPGITGGLGPTGVFCGDPVGQPVMHYGHGYIFFVEQGYAKFGEVIPDLTVLLKFSSPNGFNWVGYGLPGDSGSGVMNDAGLAVGDLTHGVSVAGVPVPGLNFGTDMQGIFNFIGTSYKLVTVDGRATSCASPLGV